MKQIFQARRGLYDDALPVLSKYFSKYINVLDSETKEFILYANISNKNGNLGLVLAWPKNIFINKVMPAYNITMTTALKKLLDNIGHIIALDCDSVKSGKLNFYVTNNSKIHNSYMIDMDKTYRKDLLRLTFDTNISEVVMHKHYVNTEGNKYSNKIYEIKDNKNVLVYEQPCENDDGSTVLFEDIWKLGEQLDQTKYILVGSKRSDSGNSYVAIKVTGSHEMAIADKNCPVKYKDD
jgi:hypothetical protein